MEKKKPSNTFLFHSKSLGIYRTGRRGAQSLCTGLGKEGPGRLRLPLPLFLQPRMGGGEHLVGPPLGLPGYRLFLLTDAAPSLWSGRGAISNDLNTLSNLQHAQE